MLYKKASYKKQIQALSEISQAISSDQYLDDILKLIVTVTANVMDSKICSLWLLDEREKALRIRATQTMSEEYLKERTLKLGEGVVGYVAQQNKPLAIPDVLKEPRYKEKELAKKEGLVSMLSVPLTLKDKVIGVINCYTSSYRWRERLSFAWSSWTGFWSSMRATSRCWLRRAQSLRRSMRRLTPPACSTRRIRAR